MCPGNQLADFRLGKSNFPLNPFILTEKEITCYACAENLDCGASSQGRGAVLDEIRPLFRWTRKDACGFGYVPYYLMAFFLIFM